MSDIVERLRENDHRANVNRLTYREGADEIERLRQQLTDTERLLAESQALEMERTEWLTDAIACVDGVMAECLAERLAELPDSVGTIRDIVKRRLLRASFYAREALSKTPGNSAALDAAIAKAKREVLLEAAEQIGIFEHGYECDEVLRRMADELKGGEQ